MGSAALKSFKDLDWSKKSPCHDCPFLKTSPFHEGIAVGAMAVADSIESHTFAHTCHMTDNRSACDGPRNWKKRKPQHCAGAILMMLKTGEGSDLQLPFLKAVSAGLVDIADMQKRADKDDRVFTLKQFLMFNAVNAIALWNDSKSISVQKIKGEE